MNKLIVGMTFRDYRIDKGPYNAETLLQKFNKTIQEALPISGVPGDNNTLYVFMAPEYYFLKTKIVNTESTNVIRMPLSEREKNTIRDGLRNLANNNKNLLIVGGTVYWVGKPANGIHPVYNTALICHQHKCIEVDKSSWYPETELRNDIKFLGYKCKSDQQNINPFFIITMGSKTLSCGIDICADFFSNSQTKNHPLLDLHFVVANIIRDFGEKYNPQIRIKKDGFFLMCNAGDISYSKVMRKNDKGLIKPCGCTGSGPNWGLWELSV